MNYFKLLTLVALLFGAAIQPSKAQDSLNEGLTLDINPVAVCVIPKLDGDKVPFPLRSANTKFDLSDGETYILNGFITAIAGKPMFRPDFVSQPWMNTNTRMANPFIGIDPSNAEMVRKFEDGRMVQIAVMANRIEGSLFLKLLAPPARFK